MSAAKLPLKPTDKDCQQGGGRGSFWPTLMPGLITGNYREEARSRGRDGQVFRCHEPPRLKPSISQSVGLNAAGHWRPRRWFVRVRARRGPVGLRGGDPEVMRL